MLYFDCQRISAHSLNPPHTNSISYAQLCLDQKFTKTIVKTFRESSDIFKSLSIYKLIVGKETVHTEAHMHKHTDFAKLAQMLWLQQKNHLFVLLAKRSQLFTHSLNLFPRNTTEDWNYYFHMENQGEEILSLSDAQRKKGLT